MSGRRRLLRALAGRLPVPRARVAALGRELEVTRTALAEASTALSQARDEVGRLERDRWSDAVTARPSFRYKLAEAQRQRAHAREHCGWIDPLLHLEDKLLAYRLADDLGIPRPAVLDEQDDVAAFDWDALPERFVVKSVGGAVGRGVWPLVREGDRFRHLLTGAQVDAAGVVAEYRERLEARRIRRRAFVEELLLADGERGGLPHDWKVYCFDGRAELVLQKDLRGSPRARDWRYRLYDRDWADLGPARPALAIDADLPPPHHPEALLAAAERMSAALERPFVRIDLYDLPDRGVRFGEITPHPGGDQTFVPDLDERLGAAWERAEAALRARWASRGADPLKTAIPEADPGWT